MLVVEPGSSDPEDGRVGDGVGFRWAEVDESIYFAFDAIICCCLVYMAFCGAGQAEHRH